MEVKDMTSEQLYEKEQELVILGECAQDDLIYGEEEIKRVHAEMRKRKLPSEYARTVTEEKRTV